MAYYVLDSENGSLVGTVTKKDGPALFDMTRGEPYEVDEGELPFRFEYSYPEGAQLPEFYASKCLMSARLIDVLRAAGVDNLQVLAAVLVDKRSGAERTDFSVVNVIGLVAAADPGGSESMPLAGGQVFTKLVVDDARPHALKLFRLAESLIEVVVDESVATAVRSAGLFGVALLPATK